MPSLCYQLLNYGHSISTKVIIHLQLLPHLISLHLVRVHSSLLQHSLHTLLPPILLQDHPLYMAIPCCIPHVRLFGTIGDIHPVHIQGVVRFLDVGGSVVKDKHPNNSWIFPLEDAHCLPHLVQEEVIREIALGLVLHVEPCLLLITPQVPIDFIYQVRYHDSLTKGLLLQCLVRSI